MPTSNKMNYIHEIRGDTMTEYIKRNEIIDI